MQTKSFAAHVLIVAACPLVLPALAFAANPGMQGHETYKAELSPMNTRLTGQQTTGHATFEIKGDTLSIAINVKNAPANVEHWQHFHGLKGTLAAGCATQAADVNGDGIVDLIETEPASGTTMVPFDNMPAAMDVAHGVYPKASAAGSYEYQEAVSVKALAAAFSKAFDGQALNLDKRVVLIHGVPSDTRLPSTVQSLGPIPAQVTVPIACGKIERVHQ